MPLSLTLRAIPENTYSELAALSSMDEHETEHAKDRLGVYKNMTNDKYFNKRTMIYQPYSTRLLMARTLPRSCVEPNAVIIF